MADLKLMQPSFTAGELSPDLWARTDLTKYRVGLRRAKNVFVHPHGGVSNRPGLQFVTESALISTYPRIIPFSFNTTQNYVLEFGQPLSGGSGYMRIIKDDANILDSPALSISAVTVANPAVFTSAAHGLTNGRQVYLFGFSWADLNGRPLIVQNVTTNTFTLTDMYGRDISTVGQTPGIGGARTFYSISGPWSYDQIYEVVYAQEADVMYLVHRQWPQRKLSRTGDASWNLTTPTFTPSIVWTGGTPGVVAAPASGSVTAYNYKVAAIADSGEESLPSAASANQTNNLSTAGNKNTISWSAVAGAVRYVVYKLDNGVYGYIGGTTGTSFVDDNITADLTDTPQAGNNPFTGAGNWPGCVTFFEQRLAFGSTLNDPQAVFLSQSSSYENFGYSSPAKASDAITFRIRARQVHQIRAMMPSSQGLMLLTSGGEWIANGGDQGFISPSQIVLKPQGYRGSAGIQPIVVGATVLFGQRASAVVRDFSYDFTNDAFVGADLTILARHIFEKKQIRSWAYAQAPDSIVYVVFNDNTCATLTYLREHEVYAWTPLETDGLFRDVCVLPEDDRDVPYFIVSRFSTIDNQYHHFIEKLADRGDITNDTYGSQGVFLDSALTYVGADATVISGLWHLEGKTVNALADGFVVRGLVVSNGRITLPDPAGRVIIGLPYTADVQTLEPDLGQTAIGTVQGRPKAYANVTVRVKNSRGLWLGTSEDDLKPWKQRLAADAMDLPEPLYTGDYDQEVGGDWESPCPLWIRQSDPLPMTVLAVMPEVEIGG